MRLNLSLSLSHTHTQNSAGACLLTTSEILRLHLQLQALTTIQQNSNTDSNLSLIRSLLLPPSRSANQTKPGQERAIYGRVARDSGRWYLQRERHSCKSPRKFGVQELGLGFTVLVFSPYPYFTFTKSNSSCLLLSYISSSRPQLHSFPTPIHAALHFIFFFPIFCFRILLSRTLTTSTTAVY